MIALEAKTEKQQAEPRAALQVSGHLLSCWKICLDKYVKRKPKRFCFPHCLYDLPLLCLHGYLPQGSPRSFV